MASRQPVSANQSPRGNAAAWVFGLLLLGAVVAIVVRHGELEDLGRIVRSIRPRWLLLAIALQGATYFCAAGVWDVALRRQRCRVGLVTLARLALVMLFTNQAFPAAGLSGSAAVVRALRRRGVSARIAMSALIVGVMTTYIAYAVAVAASVIVLRTVHAVNGILLAVVGMCALIAIGIPAGVVWYQRSLSPSVRKRLTQIPGVGALLDAVARTPTRLLHTPAVIGPATVLQLVELGLDAATLQVMLAAVGVHLPATAAFSSYVIGSAVSQVVPVPLGLGSFEASVVGMLSVVGVPVEGALTATLLLRGVTFWLPMLPGLVLAREELLTRRHAARRRER